MSDTMIDRESVIRQLTQHIARADYIETDFMDCVSVPMLRGALALLKEQEPRALTIEEVACKPHKEWLWFEENVYGHIEESAMVCAQIYAFGDSWIAVDVPSQTHDETIEFDNEYYGKTWRCWSSKPTEEQRKAVKWDD